VNTTKFNYKGREVEVLGTIYGGWGFCITSPNGYEYREWSFVHPDQAFEKAKQLIDADPKLGTRS
jgi:hypothetical protein